MRTVKASACVVAVMGTLLLGGCGSSTTAAAAVGSSATSSGPSGPGPASPTTSAPAPTAASTSSAPAAPVAKTFNGASLKAALLPASALGSGLKADTAGMFVGDQQSGQVSLVTTEDCELVLAAGFSFGSGSQVQMSTSNQGGSFTDVTQELYQFDPGIAASAFPVMGARIDTGCKSFSYTTKDGTKVRATARQHSVSGLGDQAMEIQEVVTWPSLTFQVRALAVRYGDVVIVAVVDTSDQSRTKAYDLAGKVKAIAAALKLP